MGSVFSRTRVAAMFLLGFGLLSFIGFSIVKTYRIGFVFIIYPAINKQLHSILTMALFYQVLQPTPFINCLSLCKGSCLIITFPRFTIFIYFMMSDGYIFMRASIIVFGT